MYDYLDTNLLYRLAKDINGQFMHVISPSTSTDLSTSTSDKVLASVDIETSPDTAFQIFGLAMFTMLGTSSISTSTSAGTMTSDVFAETALSYYQPSPPASNKTTLASTTGNLEFRNHFWRQLQAVQQQFVNLGGASTGVGVGVSNEGQQITVVLAEPITIVGEGIVALGSNPNSLTATYVRVGAWIVGKYVHINTSQYVNLVALATGQAILPPSILG